MERLTGLDGAFLSLESPTTHLQILGALVFDPGRGGRGRATSGPSGASSPTGCPWSRRSASGWSRSPSACSTRPWSTIPTSTSTTTSDGSVSPSPAGIGELADLVADLASRPLDRRRPLWEFHVVEGLEHGRLAIVPKVHHSIIDGVSGAQVMAAFFDLSNRCRPLSPSSGRTAAEPTRRGQAVRPAGTEPPGPRSRLVAGPAAGRVASSGGTCWARCPVTPTRWCGRCLGVSGRPKAVSSSEPGGVTGRCPRPLRGAPHVDQPGHLAPPAGGAGRTAAVRRAAGPPGARRHHQRRGPGGDLGRHALVLRRPGRGAGELVGRDGAGLGAHRGGGRHPRQPGVGHAGLAGHDGGDPVARLRRIHEGTRTAKEQSRFVGREVFAGWAQAWLPVGGHPTDPPGHQPPSLRPRGAAVQPHRVQRARDRTSRCIWPGPAMVAMYPLGPIIEGVGMNVTVFSYLDTLYVGVQGCWDAGSGHRRHRRGHGGRRWPSWSTRPTAGTGRCRGGTPSSLRRPRAGSAGRRCVAPLGRSPPVPEVRPRSRSPGRSTARV